MTCKPLEIMRLTALLPPPPTPMTLILADSIGEKEHLNRVGLDLCFEKTLLILVLLCSEWGIDFARKEEEIGSSLSWANGRLIAIFCLYFLSISDERQKKKYKDGSFRVLVKKQKKNNINSGRSVLLLTKEKLKRSSVDPFRFQ